MPSSTQVCPPTPGPTRARSSAWVPFFGHRRSDRWWLARRSRELCPDGAQDRDPEPAGILVQNGFWVSGVLRLWPVELAKLRFAPALDITEDRLSEWWWRKRAGSAPRRSFHSRFTAVLRLRVEATRPRTPGRCRRDSQCKYPALLDSGRCWFVPTPLRQQELHRS
jgi:hypothetical protein